MSPSRAERLGSCFSVPVSQEVMSGTIVEVWWANILDLYGEKTIATVGTSANCSETLCSYCVPNSDLCVVFLRYFHLPRVGLLWFLCDLLVAEHCAGVPEVQDPTCAFKRRERREWSPSPRHQLSIGLPIRSLVSFRLALPLFVC